MDLRIAFRIALVGGPDLYGAGSAEERLGLEAGDLAREGDAALRCGGRLLRALCRCQLAR